ncbi:hypothetical protein SAMN05444396_10378 [Flavobacterium segetis]|uniref:Lipid A 3-O-deacylase (PagL) n=1 Tax=Flavobacterium segetis TaxID=271157 RepID=A0A1M5FVS4_9FLAO|nr:hypothetical protein [Flavobacterium segetis]SHF95539.1 hypothetical protein SAMN05444396_10378 [Flavobacterium segetis]
MNQSIALILFLFLSLSALSQNKKSKYFQFDITAAIRGNPDAAIVNQYTQKKGSWLIPDGLGTKIGYGIQYKEWIGLGIHTGINWEWKDQLVVAPVFANFKLSPKVGEDTRITLQLGYGKALAIGRGSLMGDYKKVSLGIQTIDDIIIFIELNHYSFPINNQKDSGNISLGISLLTF